MYGCHFCYTIAQFSIISSINYQLSIINKCQMIWENSQLRFLKINRYKTNMAICWCGWQMPNPIQFPSRSGGCLVGFIWKLLFLSFLSKNITESNNNPRPRKCLPSLISQILRIHAKLSFIPLTHQSWRIEREGCCANIVASPRKK